MSGAIWLIAEDEEDVETIRVVLQRRGLSVSVKPGFLKRGRGAGGISRLASQLEEAIKTAISRKGQRDCIAVLYDADEQKLVADPDLYRRIQTVCNRYSEHVTLVAARNAFESWLLADEGLCSWLDIPARNWDEETNPDRILERYLKDKKGLKYQGRGREQVRSHLDGSGDRHSPSLSEALKHLENAPCVT